MISKVILTFLLGIVSFVQARPSPLPRVSLSRPNATTSTTLQATLTSRKLASAPSSTSLSYGSKPFPPSPSSSAVCCFVVQDTISEEWWEELSATSVEGLVNVTTIVTYFSKGSDGVGTIITSNSSVTLKKTKFVVDVNTAFNPLETSTNQAPGPIEDGNALTGTATMTGGVLVQSPAAFYVYNSVKIITAAAVTDDDGNVMCGTSSVFPNINSNAEAYFGGPSIAGQNNDPLEYNTTITTTMTFLEPTIFTTTPTLTELVMTDVTYYTLSDGSTITPSPNQPGSVISLTEPFIYQPAWASNLASTPQCLPGMNTEEYGYIPQTLLDYLIQNPYYSAQYPGLASCLPGGPSIITAMCPKGIKHTSTPPFPTTVAIPAGGGLTSQSTAYVGANVITTTATPQRDMQGTLSLTPPANTLPNPSPNPTSNTVPAPAPTSTQDPPPDSRHGPLTTINNLTPTPTPAPQPALFSSTILSGTSLLIIPATTIPLSLAPSGLQGLTTTISRTPYLIITSPTSLALPLSPSPEVAIQTTMINGIPYPLPQHVPGFLTTVPGNGEVDFVLTAAMTVPVGEMGGLEVEGRTTVIGGVTEVVVSSGVTMELQSASASASGEGGVLAATSVGTSLGAGIGASSTPTVSTVKNGGGKMQVGWMLWVAGLGVVILVLW
ncbi:hypothetical protein L207DRAFT_631169 [Hyaloscypha variabilis F]|uniref:Uncharacterized protein n=1 Tax=Hyaloscypha variabilis (strain UAMH 11265 / GT02V1 / F) TaxID=1149755 RepID=A0A2J6RWV1_HYAVF|nr:hypothetical protein L207DRAFT_631169 [Hyaloscypha variabilis F]